MNVKKILLLIGFCFFFAMPAIANADCHTSPENEKCSSGKICEYNTITNAWECIAPSDAGYGIRSDETFEGSFSDISVQGDTDLKSTTAQIINIVLGFLGIVAVIIILAGGFKWMTAGGNEDKVAEARQMIIQGVIGLVIIFASWAIASFVITQLRTSTT